MSFKAGDSDWNEAANPLYHLPFNSWWFHGYGNSPPEDGQFLELPAGGTFHAEIACNKHFTSFGDHTGDYTRYFRYGCDARNLNGDWVNNPNQGTGMEHSTDLYQNTTNDVLVDVRGSAIAISYESDFSKLKPEDFVVISVNYRSPWYRLTDFDIPADLPECPEGGCHCLWSWFHGPDGGGDEMLLNGYRCKVTGATGTAALPKGEVARKCPFNKNNCTIGAKVPFYWDQAEQNNFFQGFHDPPFYNGDYGFMDGAQTDLFLRLDDNPGYVTDLAPYPLQTASMGLSVTAATVTGTRISGAVAAVATSTGVASVTTAATAVSTPTDSNPTASAVGSNDSDLGTDAAPTAAAGSAANEADSSSATGATESSPPVTSGKKKCKRSRNRRLHSA